VKKLLALITAAFALSLTAGCAEVVDNGNAGVRSRYGAVEQKSLPPGFYWYNPLTTSIEEMNTQVIKWAAETPVYTRDIQQGQVKFTVTYHLNPNRAHVMYQKVGMDWADRLLPQVITQSIKNEFGRWNAVNVIANRGVVQANVANAIAPKLLSKAIILDGFEITNIDYTDAFEQAVEDKEVAVQTAIAEQNRTKQIEEKGKQQVIQAEAEAKSIKLRSDALSANPKLVEWEAVQKWDGQLPQNMYGGAALPFVNVR
jgi:regulator of protease activity HflC (stomatin/prohibitin superfamily)